MKPNVDYFRVFGCIDHVHVPDAKRTKLKDKRFKAVLLRISEESKACLLFDPIMKRVVTSRDAVFEENKSWDWSRSEEEGTVHYVD